MRYALVANPGGGEDRHEAVKANTLRDSKPLAFGSAYTDNARLATGLYT